MPFIIAALVDALEWLFTTYIGLWIVKAFVFLGISLGVQHFVVGPFLDQIKALANAGVGGGELGQTALAWMGVLKFDRCISMIISAVAAKYTVNAAKLFLQKRST